MEQNGRCAWEREVRAWERVLSSQMIAIELPNHTMQQHATREPKASRVLLLLCVMPVRDTRCGARAAPPVICELASTAGRRLLTEPLVAPPSPPPSLDTDMHRVARYSHHFLPNPAGFEPRMPHVSNSGPVCRCVAFPHITCELACTRGCLFVAFMAIGR